MTLYYQKVKGESALGTPVGTIVPFTAASTPAGFLLCDGAAVSRTTYAALFAVMGTTYGVGDGSSTFNVPNLSGKIPLGRDGSTYNEGAAGGSASVTPTISTTDNIGLTDGITVNDNISVSDNISVGRSGSVSGNISGAPAKGNLAANNTINGAPAKGNLLGNATVNGSVANHTLSNARIPSHSHSFAVNQNTNAVGGGYISRSGNNRLDANFGTNNAGSGGAHAHGDNFVASTTINGAPTVGNLAGNSTINGAPTAGNLAVSVSDNISINKSGSASKAGSAGKSGTVNKNGTVNANSSSVSTIQPYTVVRYAVKF